MNLPRSQNPRRWPTFAAVGLAVFVMVGSAGIELGLFQGGEAKKAEVRPKATPASVVQTRPPRRLATRPEFPIEIIHDAEPGEALMPPSSIAVENAVQPRSDVAKTTIDEADPEKAARRWRARLGLLHRRMHNRGVDAGSIARKAIDELNQVDDPRAAQEVWRVFAGHPAHHLLVARWLASVESPASSRMLAALTVYSPDEKARAVAEVGLKERDPVDFAGPLIALLGPELKCRASTLPTSPGGPILQALEVEDERFIKQFVYFAEPIPGDPASTAFGCGAMPSEFDQTRAALTQELAELQLRSDLEAVDALNHRIRTINDRARATLSQSSGRDFGLDRDAWFVWLASKSGKPYTPSERLAKIPLQQFVEPIYVPTFVEVPPVPS